MTTLFIVQGMNYFWLESRDEFACGALNMILGQFVALACWGS